MKILTPHAVKGCTFCLMTPGFIGEEVCACRFEEACSSFWARIGQEQGWSSTRDPRSLIFVKG